MTAKAVLSSKGQVVIPKKMREKLGLHSGYEFAIGINSQSTIELKPIKRNLKDFFSIGKKLNVKKITEDVDELISQAIIENDDRS